MAELRYVTPDDPIALAVIRASFRRNDDELGVPAIIRHGTMIANIAGLRLGPHVTIRAGAVIRYRERSTVSWWAVMGVESTERDAKGRRKKPTWYEAFLGEGEHAPWALPPRV